MTLLWLVLPTNAAALMAATLVLALSPVTVSFSIALAELVGLSIVIAANPPAVRECVERGVGSDWLGDLRLLGMRPAVRQAAERAALEDG